MRALVYVCVHWCGGLGDRLSGIISSYIVSKETNRQFYIHAPTTFDSSIAPAEGMHWNASLPHECQERKPISVIDRDHEKFLVAAHGEAPCVMVKINQDRHTDQERKQALAELFAPLHRPAKYAALHLRTGGNCAYPNLDPGRDTVEHGMEMLKRLVSEKLKIYIVSDCLEAKIRLAEQCRTWKADCVYRRGASRHIDRQKTSGSDLADVWGDFRVLAGAAALEHSPSGFSAIAALWPHLWAVT